MWPILAFIAGVTVTSHIKSGRADAMLGHPLRWIMGVQAADLAAFWIYGALILTFAAGAVIGASRPGRCTFTPFVVCGVLVVCGVPGLHTGTVHSRRTKGSRTLIITEGLPPLVCGTCDSRYDVSSLAWRCGCGGVFDIDDASGPLDITAQQRDRDSLWRYESVLPVPFDGSISLGEGRSPIVAAHEMPGIGMKLDFLMPTLSFKDRGAVVLATLAKRLGVASARCAFRAGRQQR